MILTQEELLEEVKGKDEDGKSKAQVTVGIMDVLNNEMVDSVTSLYGVLDVAIVPDYNSAFELVYTDSADYEFVQMTGIVAYITWIGWLIAYLSLFIC